MLININTFTGCFLEILFSNMHYHCKRNHNHKRQFISFVSFVMCTHIRIIIPCLHFSYRDVAKNNKSQTSVSSQKPSPPKTRTVRENQVLSLKISSAALAYG